MSEAWETDFRWRRIKVSSDMINELLRGAAAPIQFTTAPPDLTVIGLTHVQPGPQGWYEFVVWSATFEPVPHGDGLPYEPFPLVEYEYMR